MSVYVLLHLSRPPVWPRPLLLLVICYIRSTRHPNLLSRHLYKYKHTQGGEEEKEEKKQQFSSRRHCSSLLLLYINILLYIYGGRRVDDGVRACRQSLQYGRVFLLSVAPCSVHNNLHIHIQVDGLSALCVCVCVCVCGCKKINSIPVGLFNKQNDTGNRVPPFAVGRLKHFALLNKQ